mmetsp:Transcript_90776/g.256337  ORF Transcript_90776/g.256337 Transcript_90776/m.256337 type:complete len:248 (-) Transcript_90776:1381-2124(-)
MSSEEQWTMLLWAWPSKKLACVERATLVVLLLCLAVNGFGCCSAAEAWVASGPLLLARGSPRLRLRCLRLAEPFEAMVEGGVEAAAEGAVEAAVEGGPTAVVVELVLDSDAAVERVRLPSASHSDDFLCVNKIPEGAEGVRALDSLLPGLLAMAGVASGAQGRSRLSDVKALERAILERSRWELLLRVRASRRDAASDPECRGMASRLFSTECRGMASRPFSTECRGVASRPWSTACRAVGSRPWSP